MLCQCPLLSISDTTRPSNRVTWAPLLSVPVGSSAFRRPIAVRASRLKAELQPAWCCSLRSQCAALALARLRAWLPMLPAIIGPRKLFGRPGFDFRDQSDIQNPDPIAAVSVNSQEPSVG